MARQDKTNHEEPETPREDRLLKVGDEEVDDSGALKPGVEIAEARDRRRAFAEEPEPSED